ncbi:MULTISPECIES: hypothetical protein [unclassified Mesorhizobium]|uniref:hypothetical protein n=1 Tax=unclassified Mesorhizobium TaxID=325217 RepID=UPI000FCBDFFB|nr:MULTISPECIES: hypothetical protein [unclassified Mesorhizobium]RUX96173.1 hypothetical protein EN993_08660 [Mesorhizobium sp. M7D.F.Ca.US.004.01.2.1]RVA31780.1 hypothetical protein EN935_12970 [Mesorhizobium sp. M7D.F.Ca.US.004.03.1.1]
MWEAMMLLRLLASASPRLSLGHARRGLPLSRRGLPLSRRGLPLSGRGLPLSGRGLPLALPADTLKGAIRLSFAAWRLSLPFAEPLNNQGHHDRKIA